MQNFNVSRNINERFERMYFIANVSFRSLKEYFLKIQTIEQSYNSQVQLQIT